MKINPIRIFIAIVLWLVSISFVIAVYAYNWLHEERDIFDEHPVYEVPKGGSLIAVAEDLGEKGIIHWPKLWLYYARFTGMTNIKAGEYAFDTPVSPIDVIELFNRGDVVQYRISLIEGTRFVDFLGEIRSHEKLQKTFEMNDYASALATAGIAIDHPEGWFYPDTYMYSAGDTDMSLLKRSYDRLQHVLDEEWERRAPNLPYKSAYEALIMASIIEKETGVPQERPEIAGVFVRRLNAGMRLDTDPTVIYGMGKSYRGNITRKDLRKPTPYNTYVIKGLPPTPIAMVGREAIHAALNPKEGSSLYFVAKGDGTHYFSDTLEQHNRAVREYQLRRRKDYRSTPEKVVEDEREG